MKNTDRKFPVVYLDFPLESTFKMVTSMYGTRFPNGYWKHWNNLEKCLLEVMASNHGLIPTKSQFAELGLRGLETAIQNYWGGLTKIRKKFGVFGLKYCRQCDTVKTRDGFRNRQGGYTIDSICRECSHQSVRDYRGTVRGRSAEILRRVKNRAKSKNLEFNLDRDWIEKKLISICDRCELTGIKFTHPYQAKVGYYPFSLSVDRINSSKGYTKDNVRFIILQLNAALQSGSDENFELIAIKFLKNRGFSCQKTKEE